MPETLSRPRSDAALTPQGQASHAALTVALDALTKRVQAIEDRLGATLSRADRERLGRLLPALSGALGSAAVTSREVIAHPSPALRLTVGGLSARSLGRLARRAAGIPINGLVLERAGTEAGAALWCVRAVIDA